MALLGFSQGIADHQLGIALTDTAWVLDHTAGRTSSGATTDTYVKREASVPCAVAPKAGGEYLGVGDRAQKVAPGDRIDERRDNIITLPAATAITQRDRIEVEDEGVFEVTSVPPRSTELGLQVEARALED